ncbi:MAG: response regulator transcription factor [Terriglobia bacterium]
MGHEEKRVRVLIADDDQKFRIFIRRVLEAQANLAVIGEAQDGEEAVKKAQEMKPEMVIMDMDMPGIDGLEAARRVKASLPRAVVVMFSPAEGTAYRDAAARSGADEFLLKTASILQIHSTIRGCCPSKGVSGEFCGERQSQ